MKSRNDPVRLFWRRLAIVGLVVLVGTAVSGVWNAYQKETESATLREQAEAQLNDLSAQKSQLDADIAKLGTERGQEEVLRDQYALAAKGEDMVIIVNSSATEVHATSSAFAKWLHQTFPWW
jgi:outer membrane murein-binding lipoprotein Lpp